MEAMTVCGLADVTAALAWLQHLAPGARLRTDSRRVQPGDVFIAWPGYAQDGRQHVPAALAAGAAACLVEAEGVDAFGFTDPRIAALAGLKSATAVLADHWHGQPSQHLRTVASTGTNGKTSTAWWMAQALSLSGQRCGLIGTLGVGEPPSRVAPQAQVIATGLTTPDPVTLQRSLRDFVDRGFAACAMEASSIGVVEQRLNAVHLDVALFTNFTPDHLDYHGTMAAYWQAKRALFDWPGLQAAVINLDDAAGAGLAAELCHGRLQVCTYSLHAASAAASAAAAERPIAQRHLQASDLHYDAGGLCFTVTETGAHTETCAVRSQLIGEYNAANVLAVLGGLRALGVPLAEAAARVADFTPVPGRMQRVAAPQTVSAEAAEALPQVVVDYAHTPDALEKALQALRPFAQARGGRLWCVFGCGGNRDATKRPVMGRLAQALADAVIITSDNPRHENPADILAHIAAGITAATGPDAVATNWRCVEDRAEAIATALREAAPTDVVLIAGKGHEDYQEVAGVKRHFSDVEQAAAALAQRAGSAPVTASAPVLPHSPTA